MQAVGNWLFALRERMGRMHDTGKRAGICWPRTTTRSRVRGGEEGQGETCVRDTTCSRPQVCARVVGVLFFASACALPHCFGKTCSRMER